jgi:HSP20 family protein
MALIRWKENRDLPAFPSEVLNMQREINRMFDGFFRGGADDEGQMFLSSWSPATDIVEHENEYVVNLELPGVDKDDVKITMQENLLTIRGQKKEEKESNGSQYRRVERSYGEFQRTFQLPSSVKSDRIEAAYRDGILTVSLPKAEEARSKQIEVKVK